MVLTDASRGLRQGLGHLRGLGIGENLLPVLGTWHVTIVVVIGGTEIIVTASSTEKHRTVGIQVRIQLLTLMVILLMEMRRSSCWLEQSISLQVAERFVTVVDVGDGMQSVGTSYGRFWETAHAWIESMDV